MPAGVVEGEVVAVGLEVFIAELEPPGWVEGEYTPAGLELSVLAWLAIGLEAEYASTGFCWLAEGE